MQEGKSRALHLFRAGGGRNWWIRATAGCSISSRTNFAEKGVVLSLPPLFPGDI